MFCQQNNLQLIELNFKQSQTLHSLFASNDPIKIIQSLEILENVKIDMERAVLFLDEIQANPAAILSLRYFFEKVPQLAVIAAGAVHRTTSPVQPAGVHEPRALLLDKGKSPIQCRN
jgi:predicted AAA+ superfamily ATPase